MALNMPEMFGPLPVQMDSNNTPENPAPSPPTSSRDFTPIPVGQSPADRLAALGPGNAAVNNYQSFGDFLKENSSGYQDVASKYQPSALPQGGLHGAIADALIAMANIGPSRTPGEGISNVARALIGMPQERAQVEMGRVEPQLQHDAAVAKIYSDYMDAMGKAYYYSDRGPAARDAARQRGMDAAYLRNTQGATGAMKPTVIRTPEGQSMLAVPQMNASTGQMELVPIKHMTDEQVDAFYKMGVDDQGNPLPGTKGAGGDESPSKIEGRVMAGYMAQHIPGLMAKGMSQADAESKALANFKTEMADPQMALQAQRDGEIWARMHEADTISASNAGAKESYTNELKKYPTDPAILNKPDNIASVENRYLEAMHRNGMDWKLPKDANGDIDRAAMRKDAVNFTIKANTAAQQRSLGAYNQQIKNPDWQNRELWRISPDRDTVDDATIKGVGSQTPGAASGKPIPPAVAPPPKSAPVNLDNAYKDPKGKIGLRGPDGKVYLSDPGLVQDRIKEGFKLLSSADFQHSQGK